MPPVARRAPPTLRPLPLVVASLAITAACAGEPSAPPPAAAPTAAPPTATAAPLPAAVSAAAPRTTVEVEVPAQAAAALPAGAGLGETAPQAAGDALRIAWLLPEGEITARTQGSLGFDRPVRPLGVVDDDAKAPWLHISPAVPLRLRWIDPQTLAIAAVGGWPPAQTFELRVDAGVRALDGTALAAPVQARFRTAALRVARVWPEGGPQPLATGIAIAFTESIEAAAVQRQLRLTAQNAKGEALTLPALTLEVPTDLAALRRALAAAHIESAEVDASDVGRTAVGRFSAALPTETRVEATLSAGVAPRRGDRPTGDDKRWRFATHGPFVVESISCRGGCEPDDWRPLRIAFSNPVASDDGESDEAASARLAAAFEVTPPLAHFGVSCFADTCSLGGELKPATTYTVRVLPKLRDAFGQALAAGHEAVITTGHLGPLVVGLTDGAVFERHQPPWTYAYDLRNVDATLRLGTLAPRDWATAALQGYGGSTEAAAALTKAPVVRALAGLRRDVTERRVVDLGEVLGLRGPAQAFLDVSHKGADGRRYFQGQLVQITDLHLHVRTYRGGALAFVTSFSTGRTVPGAAVEAIDDKGVVLGRGVTGEDGAAELTLTAEAALVRAQKADDVAQLVVGWDARERGDWQDPVVLRSVLFFEKELFSPGETAHLRGILRRVDGPTMALPVAPAATVVLRDPYGDEVLRKEVRFSRHGAFALELPLPKKPRYGTWSADVVYEVGASRLEDAATFRIAVYEPQRVQAALTLDRGHLLAGATAMAVVEASWLSGGPMRDGAVALQVLGSRERYQPPGWDSFAFGLDDEGDGVDSEGHDGEAPALTGAPARDDKALAPFEHTAAGHLDAAGRVRLAIPAGSHVASAQRLLVEATVTDPSGSALTRQGTLWLQPAARLVGVRPSSVVVTAGGPLLADVVVTDVEGKVAAGTVPEVRLLSRIYKTIRREGVGGTWEWQTEVVDAEVARCRLEAGGQDAPGGSQRCTFTPPAAGTYIIEASVRDAQGRPHQSRAFVWATGPGEVAWGGDDAKPPLLVTDKARYNVGDTARILVRNPTPGAVALVTEDRGRVRRRRVVALDHAASTIEVPLGEDAIPNLYVSVVVMRGRQRSGAPARLDLGAPALHVDAIGLQVDASAHRLRVEVAPHPTAYRPGGQVEVVARVLDAAGAPADAEVTLAVVDEGVLQLSGTKTPDPFAPLYAEHPHAVSDYALMGKLVRKRVGEDKGDAGGDGGDGAALVRGDFRDLAYYAPALKTDGQGRIRARFALPDNLTAFRVMAVAIRGAADFGSGEGMLRVGKPLMVTPRLPRFAQPGDVVEVSAMLRHGGEGQAAFAGALEVALQGDAATLEGPALRDFRLEPGGVTELRLPLRIGKVGRVGVRLRAKVPGVAGQGAIEDAVEGSFEVIDLRPRETSAVFAKVEPGAPWRQRVLRPAGSLDDGGLRVELASSAVAGLRGDIDALLAYPFGCAEQTASQLLAAVELRRLKAMYGLWPELEDGALAARVDEALQRLERLRSGPSYAMWPGGDADGAPVANAWIAIVLQRAQAAGVDLPPGRLEGLAGHLHGALADKRPGRALGEDGRARLVHALARLGALPDVDAGALFALRTTLSRTSRIELGVALSFSDRALRLGQAAQLADEEAGRLQVEAASAHLLDEADPYWGSAARDEALLLELLLRTRPQHPLLDRLGAGALQRRAERFATTQDHAAALIGVGAWLAKVEAVAPDLRVSARLADKAMGGAAFVGRSALPQRMLVPQSALPAGVAAEFALTAAGKGPLYAGLRYDYLLPAVADAPRNAGMLVRRTVLGADGSVNPQAVARGAFVAVTVEVWSGLQRSDVAIVDPLPAGLEAVDFELSGQPEIVRRKLMALDTGAAVRASAAAGATPDVNDAGDDDQDGADEGAWQFHASHRELTPEGVRFFADHLPAGRSVFRYVARARSRGVSRWQGSDAHQMYAPEVFGRAASTTLRVD